MDFSERLIQYIVGILYGQNKNGFTIRKVTLLFVAMAEGGVKDVDYRIGILKTWVSKSIFIMYINALRLVC